MERESLISSATTASATFGAVAIACVLAVGGGASGTLTILDGTATKWTRVVGITADYASPVFVPPIAFRNLIVTNSGTMNYSVVYIPR